MNRRRFLAATAGAVGLAGCIGSGGSSGDDGTTTGDGGDGSTGGDGTTDWDGEPAILTREGTAGLANQPALGPDPFEATATVVAFEDPSCTTCRRFERGTLPELEAGPVADGSLSFVYRVFPVVYPWGKPAVQALEATYARDEAAFWALKAHYYEAQPEFDAANALARTETFLAENTDLDGAAVVADAGAEAFDDAVRADLDAGRAAGFSATPSFLLFREGEFVTELVGAKSFSVFTNALQL